MHSDELGEMTCITTNNFICSRTPVLGIAHHRLLRFGRTCRSVCSEDCSPQSFGFRAQGLGHPDKLRVAEQELRANLGPSSFRSGCSRPLVPSTLSPLPSG